MRAVIVPNSLSDAINRALDAAIIECPDAEQYRQQLFEQLLDYFDEHGTLPEFSITKTQATPNA